MLKMSGMKYSPEMFLGRQDCRDALQEQYTPEKGSPQVDFLWKYDSIIDEFLPEVEIRLF